MSFATATPLGTTSECEFVDIWTKEVLDPAETMQIITDKMAPGIKLLEINEVPTSGKKLQVLTIDSTFEITITEDVSRDELIQRVADLLAADEIMRERVVKKKLKKFDLRPMVYDLAVQDGGDGESILLIARLALEPSKTCLLYTSPSPRDS